MSKIPYENLPSYSEAMSSNPPVDQVPISSGMVHEQMSAMPTAPYPPHQYQSVPPHQYQQAPPHQYQQAPPHQYQQAPPHQYQPAPTIIMPPPTNTTTVINNTTPQVVLMGGGCPTCRVGVLKEQYTWLAWFCAIVFFPAGILCCLCMTHKKCTNCGTTF